MATPHISRHPQRLHNDLAKCRECRGDPLVVMPSKVSRNVDPESRRALLHMGGRGARLNARSIANLDGPSAARPYELPLHPSLETPGQGYSLFFKDIEPAICPKLTRKCDARFFSESLGNSFSFLFVPNSSAVV